MTDGGYILGIDLGTTSLKGSLFEASGALVASTSTLYPTSRLADGRVEQDPEDWFTAFWTVVGRLLDGRRAGELAAIGICGQVNTNVFVDSAGRPLVPAITWQDTRAAGEAALLDSGIAEERRLGWWPSGMAVSASHTLARIAWMARERPDIWQRTAKVLTPKDYLLRHLTGRWTGDPLSNFDLVDQSGDYITELIALVPGAAERLPPLSSYRTAIGSIEHPRLVGCTAAVVNGTMDAFGCLFGSGASRPGEGSYISGTSEIVALIGGCSGGAPGIVSFVPVDGWHVQAGPTQSGGDTLRWLATLLGCTHQQVLDFAATANRDGDSQLLFLPHLEGERAPMWDPHARGSMLGMTLSDGAPELALAALEGVAISARLILDGASAAIGRVPDALYIGGTGNSSDLWAQIRADVLGLPLHRAASLDTGAVGAAIMAGLGTGRFTSIQAASRAFVQIERTFLPDPGKAARYARMTNRYREAYQRLRPLYAQ